MSILTMAEFIALRESVHAGDVDILELWRRYEILYLDVAQAEAVRSRDAQAGDE